MQKSPHINTGRILRVYWEHVRRYKGRALFILLLVSLANVFDVIVPLFYKRFFDLLAGDLVIEGASTTSLLIGTLILIAAFHVVVGIGWRWAHRACGSCGKVWWSRVCSPSSALLPASAQMPFGCFHHT